MVPARGQGTSLRHSGGQLRQAIHQWAGWIPSEMEAVTPGAADHLGDDLNASVTVEMS